jgi:hypothetical protein
MEEWNDRECSLSLTAKGDTSIFAPPYRKLQFPIGTFNGLALDQSKYLIVRVIFYNIPVEASTGNLIKYR